MEYTVNLLKECADEKYADFHSGLVPTVDRQRILGVRTPVMRKLAKELLKDSMFLSDIMPSFLKELPHYYYDEMILHGEIISNEKNFVRAIEMTEEFLPYVDNWAVCDLLAPKVFAKHKSELYEIIKRWMKSENIYTVRFGIDMMIKHFLDAEFEEEHLALVRDARGDDYYIKMVKAWYYATALAKHYDTVFEFMKTSISDEWVLKKSIQKARESCRVSAEQKEELKSLLKH